MAGMAGKKFRLKVATTFGGTYDLVGGGATCNASIDGTNIDVSEFGVDYVQRIQGLKDVKISVSGNYAPSDTNGQLRIRSAFLNDTALFAKFLPDDGVTGNAGFIVEVKVASWQVNEGVNDKAAWSAELEGTGALTLA